MVIHGLAIAVWLRLESCRVRPADTGYVISIEADNACQVEAGLTSGVCTAPLMEVERRYLRTLEGLSWFGFAQGRVLLGRRNGEAPEQALLFRPAAVME